MGEVCQTVTSTWGMGGGNVPFVQSLAIRTANTNANGHGIANEVSHTLDGAQGQAVAYSFDSLSSNSMKSSNPYSGCREVELSKTLDTTYPCPSKNQGGIGVRQNMAVRRLTPIECERLQGFPDNYTNIPWRGKDVSPDGSRYKALGNSMAVPVMRWIGTRIKMLTSR